MVKEMSVEEANSIVESAVRENYLHNEVEDGRCHTDERIDNLKAWLMRWLVDLPEEVIDKARAELELI
jgi:hypothetical protein